MQECRIFCDFCKVTINTGKKGFRHGVDVVNPFYPSMEEFLGKHYSYSSNWVHDSPGSSEICKGCANKLADYCIKELIK